MTESNWAGVNAISSGIPIIMLRRPGIRPRSFAFSQTAAFTSGTR